MIRIVSVLHYRDTYRIVLKIKVYSPRTYVRKFITYILIAKMYCVIVQQLKVQERWGFKLHVSPKNGNLVYVHVLVILLCKFKIIYMQSHIQTSLINKHTYLYTHRQIHTYTYRYIDRQIHIQIHRWIDTYIDTQIDKYIDRLIDRQIHRQIDRRTDSQTARQTDRPIDRQIDRY